MKTMPTCTAVRTTVRTTVAPVRLTTSADRVRGCLAPVAALFGGQVRLENDAIVAGSSAWSPPT